MVNDVEGLSFIRHGWVMYTFSKVVSVTLLCYGRHKSIMACFREVDGHTGDVFRQIFTQQA